MHGRQELSLYSVKRAADGSVNCAAKARSGALPLRQGASNELNLVVAADEAVCLANDAGDAPRHRRLLARAPRSRRAGGDRSHASNL